MLTAHPDAQTSVLPRPVPFGKYYLLERINTGGMAEVYKAKAFGVEGFERLVAVKKILPSIAENTEFIRMFIDEAKLAGQLHHANIAQIFDLGRVDDAYYIALEYVSGKDMKEIWERAREMGKRLPVAHACYIVSKACDGLDYAHHKKDNSGNPLNIVHRDVSPQNVLIGYEGDVKLIDFGVAKAASSSSDTRVGILKGKLSYMSPEQVRGLPLDRRSDTFAVGIVLYELLTGERLFLGDSDFETLEKIRKVEVAPPTLFNPEIPPELEEIVLKALQKNPNHRYDTAHDLQLDLQRFMFAQGVHCTSKDIAAFMQQMFADDIADERAKLSYFNSLKLDILGTGNARASGEGLSWDDEESETAVFSEKKEPSRKVDLDNFIPPEDGISWAKPKARTPSENNARVRQGELRASGSHARVSGSYHSVTSQNPPAPPAPAPPPRPPAASTAPSAPRQPVVRNTPIPAPAITASEPVVPRPTGTQPVVHRPKRKSNTGLWVALVLLLFVGATVAFVLSQKGEGDAGAGQTGEIVVNIVPAELEVVVSLDGEEVFEGTPPTTIEGIEAGNYILQIAADGFEEHRQTITVDGRIIVDQELVPVDLPALAINTDPSGAEVSLDGESRGQTPTEISNLQFGESYEITIELQGYETLTRTIVANEDIEPLTLTLQEAEEVVEEPPTVNVSVASSPAGASYEIRFEDDVVASGTTPGTAEGLLQETEYVARFSMADHDDTVERFTTGTEETASVRGVLEPIRRPEPRDPEPVATNNTPRDPDPPQRDPDPEPEPDPDPEPVATGPPGSINVQSMPAARVIIDGQDTGRYTPLMGYEVSVGRHRIELVNEDFDLHRTYSIDIESGRARTIINRPQ